MYNAALEQAAKDQHQAAKVRNEPGYEPETMWAGYEMLEPGDRYRTARKKKVPQSYFETTSRSDFQQWELPGKKKKEKRELVDLEVQMGPGTTYSTHFPSHKTKPWQKPENINTERAHGQHNPRVKLASETTNKADFRPFKDHKPPRSTAALSTREMGAPVKFTAQTLYAQDFQSWPTVKSKSMKPEAPSAHLAAHPLRSHVKLKQEMYEFSPKRPVESEFDVPKDRSFYPFKNPDSKIEDTTSYVKDYQGWEGDGAPQ